MLSESIRSSFSHRAHAAAPNPLLKAFCQWGRAGSGAGRQVASLHSTAALMNVIPDLLTAGVRLWGAPTVLRDVAPAGAGDLYLHRHLGRQADETELCLQQNPSRKRKEIQCRQRAAVMLPRWWVWPRGLHRAAPAFCVPPDAVPAWGCHALCPGRNKARKDWPIRSKVGGVGAHCPQGKSCLC